MEPLRIVSVSGGKDSTALYLWAIEQWGNAGFKAVFADTGHEHPVTYNYVKNLPFMANGPEINWVRADFTGRLKNKFEGKSLTRSDFVKDHIIKHREALEAIGWTSGNTWKDMLYFKASVPIPKRQFCTELTKLQPIKEFIEKIRGDREVLNYVGIRSGESKRRSTMPDRLYNEYFDAEVFHPLLRWTEGDVFAFLESKNVPPNPLYLAGYERVGCFPCIHARKSELARLPEWAWDRLSEYEKILGRTWFPPLHPGEITTIDTMREWAKTSRGGRQFDMFTKDAADVPSCMSTWGICE